MVFLNKNCSAKSHTFDNSIPLKISPPSKITQAMATEWALDGTKVAQMEV